MFLSFAFYFYVLCMSTCHLALEGYRNIILKEVKNPLKCPEIVHEFCCRNFVGILKCSYTGMKIWQRFTAAKKTLGISLKGTNDHKIENK